MHASSLPPPLCASTVCMRVFQGLRISLRRPPPCPANTGAGGFASVAQHLGRRVMCAARALWCLRCTLSKPEGGEARTRAHSSAGYVQLGGSPRRLSSGLLPTSQPKPPLSGPGSLTSRAGSSGGGDGTERPPEFLSLFSFVLCGYRLMSMVRSVLFLCTPVHTPKHTQVTSGHAHRLQGTVLLPNTKHNHTVFCTRSPLARAAPCKIPLVAGRGMH
jgi:hypothetical protein